VCELSFGERYTASRLTEKTREANTSASPSSAFFFVALQAQGLYDAVTHLQPCEMPRSMLSLHYCVLSHSARSHRSTSIARPRHTPTRTAQLVAAYPRT
jgi:hypothetical protein